jgi:hypothetical protein
MQLPNQNEPGKQKQRRRINLPHLSVVPSPFLSKRLGTRTVTSTVPACTRSTSVSVKRKRDKVPQVSAHSRGSGFGKQRVALLSMRYGLVAGAGEQSGYLIACTPSFEFVTKEFKPSVCRVEKQSLRTVTGGYM